METSNKIETKMISARLPVDVIEILERWKDETKQPSLASCITNVVRAALEDEKRITKASEAGESVLQDDEIGVGVIQLRLPRNRDELADAFTSLMFETQERIGDRDRISALGVARARVYKLTPEYQERQNPFSPYEDEDALAEKLSND